jgi:hypothetical protein
VAATFVAPSIDVDGKPSSTDSRDSQRRHRKHETPSIPGCAAKGLAADVRKTRGRNAFTMSSEAAGCVDRCCSKAWADGALTSIR